MSPSIQWKVSWSAEQIVIVLIFIIALVFWQFYANFESSEVAHTRSISWLNTFWLFFFKNPVDFNVKRKRKRLIIGVKVLSEN